MDRTVPLTVEVVGVGVADLGVATVDLLLAAIRVPMLDHLALVLVRHKIPVVALLVESTMHTIQAAQQQVALPPVMVLQAWLFCCLTPRVHLYTLTFHLCLFVKPGSRSMAHGNQLRLCISDKMVSGHQLWIRLSQLLHQPAPTLA
jgi:hypothetical protein